MKKLVVFLFVFQTFLFAQPGSEKWQGKMGPERIERFKKMRLIEALNLSEETAIRFNAKYNSHENRVREIRESSETIQGKLADLLRLYEERGKQRKFSEKETKELQNLIDQIEANRNEINIEEQRYSKELRELFAPEQIAKYYLFQQNFEQELREALKQMRKDMPKRRMREE
ncbi:MAG: hypothetical protein QME58_01455 [Bacteroidota bacterium]|nr:hypothetical protein [Bacteroidota bacterium]